MKLNLTHLYPKNMNLYGDLGNVICLKERCKARRIDFEVQNCDMGDKLPTDSDLYFFGGGQDKDQMRVYKDLISERKREQLRIDLIEKNKPILAICGGYQLLGQFFLDSKGNRIEGLSLLPIETVAPGAELKQRALGNLITDISEHKEITSHYTGLKTLVGFENHSGRTKFLDKKAIKPLGKVLIGEGDNAEDRTDGAIYKNIIGSYMHGSLLPKNPHLADYIIKKTLENKIKDNKPARQHLVPLDDSAEVTAHNYILKRYKII
jgi:hypothetical protein